MLGEVSDTNNKFSCIDYFLIIFPDSHIQKIMMLTNRHISIVKKSETTIGEIEKKLVFLFSLLSLSLDQG